MRDETPETATAGKAAVPMPEWMRIALLTLGWVCVGLGAAGLALPVLPGVPFLIVALWAFSRSSRRFHDWLLGHRFLGPPVRRWREGRVIPVSVKAIALIAMAASLAGLVLATATPWYVLTAVATIMAMGAAYILKCPSRPRS